MNQQQQQIPTPTSGGAAPVAAQPNQAVTMGNVQLLAPQAQQMMAFAAANSALGAAAPLFPPPAVLSNGAFIAMPEMFAAQGVQAPRNSTAPAQTRPQVTMPGMATVLGSQAVANGFNMIPDAAQAAAAAAAHAANSAKPLVAKNNTPASQAPAALSSTPSALPPQNMPIPTPGPANMGGVPIPALPPHSSTAMQVQVAAAAAAAAAAPLKKGHGSRKNQQDHKTKSDGGRSRTCNLTPEEKAKQNRDRNREHARSTRLRKKAYVQKLKELVDGLHAERTEEVRKRRVAVQHLAEVQRVRRAVVRTFLRFHSNFESDSRKWMTILEDNFWFKQPVTPYRSFRRVEIEQECRVSRGIDAMIADAASVSVMVEGTGSRSARWMQIKRDEVFHRGEARNGAANMPRSIVRQNSRLQHAVSSLSSSSGSSNGSGGEEDRRQAKKQAVQNALTASASSQTQQSGAITANGSVNKVGSSSSSNDSGQGRPSNDFHDYHAPSLPDPMLDSGGSSPGNESPAESGNNGANGLAGTKHVCSDSSSGDEGNATLGGPTKKLKLSTAGMASTASMQSGMNAAVSVSTSATSGDVTTQRRSGLPPNIAKSGGISHNIQPFLGGGPAANGKNANPRLSFAPAIALPPFAGIGKRPPLPPTATTTTVGAAVITNTNPSGTASGSAPITTSAPSSDQASVAGSSTAVHISRHSSKSRGVGGDASPAIIVDNESSSSNSSSQTGQIQAYYHVNEDDMLFTEDVLMCPYIFRSQDAVLCGALAECIMPGMLRAHFSPRNKLLSLEMVYDAMGFMQQLERASGSEGTAQIVPSSLEMALSPNTTEARVITMAKPPFLIVSVNEAWTRTTKYTQMEVEGKALSILHGERTDPEAGVRPGKPSHKFEDVAKGISSCSTNVHYDKEGREFIDFVCSYPLTNANDEVTHILHVCKELPEATSPTHEFPDSNESSESMRNQ